MSRDRSQVPAGLSTPNPSRICDPARPRARDLLHQVTMADVLAQHAAHTSRLACVCGDDRYSYAELDERTNRLANALSARSESVTATGSCGSPRTVTGCSSRCSPQRSSVRFCVPPTGARAPTSSRS